MNSQQHQGEFASQEVIRPSAILSEPHARLILAGLASDDVRTGGCWLATVGTWHRFDRPWERGSNGPGDAIHVGTISCVYDSPARFCVTVHQVSLTRQGLQQGWTTASLCDDAFRYAGRTLDNCAKATVTAPPKPFNPAARDSGPRR